MRSVFSCYSFPRLAVLPCFPAPKTKIYALVRFLFKYIAGSMRIKQKTALKRAARVAIEALGKHRKR